jgi:hypothetical protein
VAWRFINRSHSIGNLLHDCDSSAHTSDRVKAEDGLHKQQPDHKTHLPRQERTILHNWNSFL